MFADVSERVLVLAPRGRDAELTRQLLERQAMRAEVCASGRELLVAMDAGAGCAVVTEEALLEGLERELARVFRDQPPWSDFPLIVLSGVHSSRRLQEIVLELGNVTLLERPITPQTLVTAVHAALRGRRRQYEARTAIEQRDQFLAMLGHELRTPLGSIVLAIELARSGRDRAPLDARLEMIARQSNLLTRLVNDLLDVARVTTGKIQLQRGAVDVDAAIHGCIAAFAEQARGRSIALVTRAESGAVIEGDAARIEQVINNLLANAIKYSPPGRTVHVSSATAGGTCEIRIRDEGIGIPPDMQARVFDLFVQIDSSLERADGGMGLGLTLVDRLVRLHGGSVEVRSEGVGHGSEFIVRLPLGAAAAADEAAAPGDARGDKIEVVLVEDNTDLRHLTSDLLVALGCNVELAENGRDGVERIVQVQPELALVDIGLPLLDGFGVAREVRRQLGDAPYLVAVTGYGRGQDREHAADAGFDMFVTKPLGADKARDLIQRALGRRRDPRRA
ncbi:MAG TPA: hybrid sensor histidine kinase/response regulator [Kofleriaceae bacterium]|nr:hybrid sensor histidine kinase/response regulator [Kofleriaceae bacterium]